ncbi:glycosyltransferase [Nocardia alni]|uniref:glycosyltransferase n=1 Tax=Nocardia alni TaxID=2815723 RepID=UPI001C238700|nr:glycosyltransferase [Nocardia alni]
MPAGITRILVVVPVHNEERLLARCLTALERAAARAQVPVRIQLVLDGCTDASTRIPGSAVEVLEIDQRNVGAARAAGFAETGSGCGAETWFATTDADSEVDQWWLRRQLAYARAGADAVAGVVSVRRWSDHRLLTARRYERRYRRRLRGRGHGHIHGANLGFRADLYWRTGGFRHLRTGEDIDLVSRIAAVGARIEWAEDVVVATSARQLGRAPAGFADHLRRIDNAG